MLCVTDNIITKDFFYLMSQVNSCYQFSSFPKGKDKVCQCMGTLCSFLLWRNSYCSEVTVVTTHSHHSSSFGNCNRPVLACNYLPRQLPSKTQHPSPQPQ